MARYGLVLAMFGAFCVLMGWSTPGEVVGACLLGIAAGMLGYWITRGVS